MPTLTTNKTFDAILDLEANVSLRRAAIYDRPGNTSGAQLNKLVDDWQNAKQELYDAIDLLTSDQIREYGRYRLTK